MGNNDITPDKERIRLDKLNASLDRKRGLGRVATAIRDGFPNGYDMTEFLGLCKKKDLDLAIKTGYVIEIDTNTYQLSGKPITHEMYLDLWLDPETLALLPEPRKLTKSNQDQLLVAPVLPGCKCKNAEIENKSYWLFTGWEKDGVLAVIKQLNDLGITVYAEQNGNNGNYKFKVPLWVTGTLNLGAEPTWKNLEENNVNTANTNKSESSISTSQEIIDNAFLSTDDREIQPSITTR